MLPRFLAVSRNELRQYRASYVDEAVVLLVVLTGFLMLVTPAVRDFSLPSSYKLYRIGYVEGSPLGGLDPYSLEMVPYHDSIEMIYASNVNEVDAFVDRARGGYVVFGSGNRKSDAALGNMGGVLAAYNAELISEAADRDPSLSGILLPLRLQVMEAEIDYPKAISASSDERRRQLTGLGGYVRDEINVNDVRSDGSVVATAGSAGDSSAPDAKAATAGAGDMSLTLPEQLNVEFPFANLYRNMTLLSPLILFSILLSLSLAREKVDRNIENLFAAPLTGTQILVGKALPYALVMLALSLIYGLDTSFGFGGLEAALVFAVISSTLLSFSMFSAVVARSYRELTFIGSFSIFTFFFFIILPNVFAGVSVLAFISPLDTVTSIGNGAAVPAADLVLSLLPYASLTCFFAAFTACTFNPESMHASTDLRLLARMFYGGLSRRLSGGAAYAAVSVALLVPFIFVIESILAYLVLPLGSIAPLASLGLLAVVEEAVKILPLLYRRMNPLLYGLSAGAAFFVTEKAFNIYLIAKVYSYLGGPYMLFLGKMLPTLIVHIAATTVFAALVYYGRRRVWGILGFFAAVSIHMAYNLMVLGGMV